MSLMESTFHAWLHAYGAAWEAGDADAYLPLFAEEAVYHWTPFEAPRRGHDEIRAALVTVLERQSDVSFRFEIIAVTGDTGWAKWDAGFLREGTAYPVRVDGVLSARFDADDKCVEFREWWHALEPGQSDEMRAVDA